MLDEALLSLLVGGGDASQWLGDIEAALSTVPPKALQRATALYVWKRQWESALPASRHGGDRKSAAWRDRDQNEKISFSSIAAAATGLGERAIQLDIALVEDLGAEDVRRLWSSPIADNAAALKTIAALEAPLRATLFDVWTATPALGFSQAMLQAKLRAPADSDETAFQKLLDAWARANSKGRRRFLTEIGLAPAAIDEALKHAQKRDR